MVKAAGGITFAQCEATAQFSGMPNTAAATGQVDFILPPQAIAEELVKISQHPYLLRQNLSSEEEQPLSDESALSEIFLLLRRTTGVNFADYKRSTVQRRIGRRMALYKQDRLADYLSYLQDHPDEVQALYRDLLIVVTQFFRDEPAFTALKERVFPQIVSGKSFDSAIRIWVAGCATGEEVYSLAICLLQFLAEQPTKPTIQIFGTDLSETAIQKARKGIYQENQIAGLSSELLRRFFVRVEKGYQISQQIREMCIFARHDLSSDPPFSSLDLISCRNVLIYFASSLQKRVLPLFHYSLKPTGFLLLGASESVGKASDLFVAVDDKSRIYARTQAPSRLNFEPTFGSSLSTSANNEESDRQERNNVSIQQQAERIILDRYTPVGVLCTQRLDILQFRGDTSAYLRPAPGEPSFNLLKMAQPWLLPELRAAIHQAQRQNSPISKKVLRGDNQRSRVEIDVIPFQATPTPESYWLVLFRHSTTTVVESDSESDRREGAEQTSEILRLRQELADSQAYLQATLEEQEATNQRLAAANEEILSSNEELQSTNEELQTTKEEVQAANEELKTTNEELQHRNLEARQSNDDLLNLLNSIEIPILMLEKDLRIRRFTPTAQRIFNLIPTDIGRPLSDIRLNLDFPDLEAAIAEAIDTPTIIRREVRDRSLHWYELCIRPYKTAEDRIDGAVVSLIDIDDLKRNAEQLQAKSDYAEAIVATVRQPLIVLDEELRVKTANQSFYEMFQVSPTQTERQLFFELGNGQWNIPQLRELLEEMLPNNQELQDFEVEHEFEGIGIKTMLLNARQLTVAEEGRLILLVFEDITQRQQFEAERTQLLDRERTARLNAEAANASKDQFISVVSHELRTPLNAISGWAQILLNSNPDEETTTRALKTIANNTRLQSQLIEDLLDISRIVRGELRLEFAPLSLTSVIEAALETVRPAAEQKGIQLQSSLADCPAVAGDANRMQQVIWNLLSNAIKFTPENGRVEIRLSCDPDRAQVWVTDTGKGISADFLPHIFDRFRQADSTSSRNQGGLGLGLAIVRELVALHQGTVGAQSPGSGQGATFTVRLPLMTAPPKPIQIPKMKHLSQLQT
ncbi:PAS domain-containing protein [Pleurocapsales cyanobacterium LEGE 10410]|nr:PAS domain-containing protein [Pleurocapsales cyanobacterium LEGE 10410]